MWLLRRREGQAKPPHPALYDKCRLAHKNYCRRAYQDATQAGILKDGPVAEAFDVASLEEALQWNEEAMKNLKYEMNPKGPTVPTGRNVRRL